MCSAALRSDSIVLFAIEFVSFDRNASQFNITSFNPRSVDIL